MSSLDNVCINISFNYWLVLIDADPIGAVRITINVLFRSSIHMFVHAMLQPRSLGVRDATSDSCPPLIQSFLLVEKNFTR